MAKPGLKKVSVDIPLAGGLDQKTTEQLVDPPALVSVSNMEVKKTGQIQKRNGYESIDTSTLDTAVIEPNLLFDHHGQLSALTKTGPYSYGENLSTPIWEQKNGSGPLPMEVLGRTIEKQDDSPVYIDTATINTGTGLIGMAWQNYTVAERNHTWFSVRDQKSGELVFGPYEFIDLGGRPIVCVTENRYFTILALDATLNQINGVRVDTSTAPFTVGAVQAAVIATVDAFDAHSLEDSTFINIITSDTAGGNTDIHRATSVPAVTNTFGPYAGVRLSDQGRTVFYNEPQSRVFYAVSQVATSDVRIFYIDDAYVGPPVDVGLAYNTNRTAVASAAHDGADKITLCQRTAAGAMWLASSLDAQTTSTGMTMWINLTSGGAASGNAGVHYHWNLASKGVMAAEGIPCVAVQTAIPRFPTPVTLLVSPYVTPPSGLGGATEEVLRVFGRLLQDATYTGPLGIADYRIGSIASTIDEFNFVFNYRRLESGGLLGNVTELAIDEFKLNFDPHPLSAARFSDLSVFSGGYCTNYDGELAFEVTPHAAPYVRSITETVGGGGFSQGVEYSYKAVWVYMDADGNIHRSTESNDRSFIVDEFGATGATHLFVNVDVPPPSALDGSTNRTLNLEIYRTVVTGGIPGLYFMLGRYLATPSAVDESYITIDDTTYTDSDLLNNGLLYTSGGVLGNLCPPAFRDVEIVNNRVWGISGEDQTEVWYSKMSQKALGPEFNGNLTIRIPSGAARLTALAAIDEKLIVFSRNNIFMVAGDGPNNTGQGGEFLGPVLISSDVGCQNRNSVVSGPFGVMFLSDKGIYLLDRGLNVQYIGAPVETETSAFQTAGGELTSTVLVEDKNQVRFSYEASLNPKTLVYDFFHEQWYVWFGGASPSIDNFRSACLWDGTWTAIGPTDVITETENAFLDRAAHIVTQIDTAWLKLSGVQDYKRMNRAMFLGRYESSGDLEIRIAYDYRPSYTNTIDWTRTELLALPGAGEPMQVGIHIPRQKCEAIKFSIREIDGTVAAGRGASYSALSLLVGVKPTLYKGRDVTNQAANPTRK